VFDRGMAVDYPLTMRHRDGTLTDVLYNASVYRDAAGNVLGDTIFANMYLAYETLSAGLRRMLDGLLGVNSSAKADASNTREDRLRDTARADARPVYEAEHPVVRTHPETGRRALYVSTRHTVRFKGMTKEESRPLIEFLQAHCTKPEFTARLRWEKGTVTIWDNRCCQHFAINDYHGQRRVLWRLPVGAEAVV